MYQQHYYVPKDTGTLTDTLLAFGVAQILADVVEFSTGQHNVILQDAGSCYLIDIGEPIQERWIEQLQPRQQIPFLLGGKVKAPPEDATGIATRSIDDEWERFHRFNEQRKQLAERKIAGDELTRALEDVKPKPDWTVVTYLGDFRMQAQNIHNVLVAQWFLSGQDFLPLNLRSILAMFASLTADHDAVAKDWKKATTGTGYRDSVTASQLFNPHMGKGQNRAKANKLTMGNEKSFWLLEYLKAVGLWKVSAPRTVQNANFRKTYTISPHRLAVNDHQIIFNRFRDRLWNDSAIKMDISAALLYTDTLLEYSVEGERIDIFDDGPVSTLVSGMDVSTYQLLSRNSYTMMNLAFIGLPDWMPHIRTYADAQRFRTILQEHRERIRSIEENRSEGYALLQHYRDFVSGNDISAFFAFSTAYSNYLISELERSHFYVKPFSETNLRRLIEMSQSKLSPILQNEGFRNIATAIRRSTVIPQYIGRKQSQFDVRYGLGQDLKRKAQYPDAFIQALSDFMQSYNEETVRVYERSKGRSRRKAITTHDIEGVVALVDEYGSETICNLLVAFGYARDPKEKSEDNGGKAANEQT